MNNLPHAPGLYMLISPSGGRYIGMTTKSMKRRFWRHVAAANAGEDSRIAMAFRKYGKEAIETILLVICADREALRIMEEKAIAIFGTCKGRNYNIRDRWNDAPDTTGYRHTAEAKRKIAAFQQGRIRSAETRARMSAVNTGKILSVEHRAKLSAAHKGRTLSAEHRANISAGNKGRIVSIACRVKISAAHKGKILSAEHRANMSAARQGKKLINGRMV